MREDTPYWLEGGDPWAPGSPATDLEAEVVVVGGGIMGVSTAYWLARLGVDVLLLEAVRLGAGASGRNAGMMLHARGPLEDPDLLRAVLAQEGLECGFAQPGHLALASTPEIWHRIQAEAESLPDPPGLVRAVSLAHSESLLGMRVSPEFLGGRWVESGGVVDPVRMVEGLARAAARRGARIVVGTTVRNVSSRRGHFRLNTSMGPARARHVVLACQRAIGNLAPEYRGATRPVAAQMMATSPIRPVFRIGLAVDWGSLYWRQGPDGAVVLGGGRMFDEAVDQAEFALNSRIQRGLERFLPQAFPDLPPFTVRRRWVGIMDASPDGRPLVGLLSALGIWVIAGFGGHGLPPALGAARALAASIVDGAARPELTPYAPSRLVGRDADSQPTPAPARA